jgi:hypothetical protein
MIDTHFDSNKLHEITTGEFQCIGSKLNVNRYTAITFYVFLRKFIKNALLFRAS